MVIEQCLAAHGHRQQRCGARALHRHRRTAKIQLVGNPCRQVIFIAKLQCLPFFQEFSLAVKEHGRLPMGIGGGSGVEADGVFASEGIDAGVF